jgi:tetraacyldisaccharide 4'-kinase
VLTRARSSLYQRGFSKFKTARPAISIGNITTGGTGKPRSSNSSPELWLQNAGKFVFLLEATVAKIRMSVLVSDGLTIFESCQAGDEPYLLASNLVGAAVVSDPNRFAAGQGAINHLAPTVLYWTMASSIFNCARDLDIVTIDATNPWGGGHLLPLGRLRESLTGLKRASCFVMTRSDQVDSVEPICHDLATLSGDRPIFLSRMLNLRITPLNPETPKAPKDPVAAFCAVGNPQSFFTHLTLNGYSPIFLKVFSRSLKQLLAVRC